MSREGTAQISFTTAGSTAGKGLVTVGLFPTVKAITYKIMKTGKRGERKRLFSTGTFYFTHLNYTLLSKETSKICFLWIYSTIEDTRFKRTYISREVLCHYQSTILGNFF